MTVNKMTAADVPAAAALEQRVFTGECWKEEDFYAALEDPARLFLAACDDGVLLGFCGLQQSFEQGDILTLAVRPDFRRRGVGSALLQALIRAFRAAGGTALFLEVRRSNTAAIALYEKNGFRRQGIRRGYYQQPDEDGLVYVLEVAQ